MTLKFSQNLPQNYTSATQSQFPHKFWITTCKVKKKPTEMKENITLGCTRNYVISQRNITLNVDIYFLTLPPAYHKEEGVFFKTHTCM